MPSQASAAGPTECGCACGGRASHKWRERVALTGGRAFPETEEGELSRGRGPSRPCAGERRTLPGGHPGLQHQETVDALPRSGLPVGARTAAAKQTALLGSPSLPVCLLTPDEGAH